MPFPPEIRAARRARALRLAPARLGAVLVLLACAALAVAADLAAFSGRVVAVADGDTLTVLAGRERVVVRLAEIDTPERGQPWASRARRALGELAFQKVVRVEPVARDRWGRLVARIRTADGVDAGRRLVRDGHAWVFLDHLLDRSLLDDEASARRLRLGLWALPEAERMPPWKWRSAERRRRAPTAPPAASRAGARSDVVGNRRSGVYHRGDCPGFDDVRTRNRVPFGTAAEAERAGYRLARNCPR